MKTPGEGQRLDFRQTLYWDVDPQVIDPHEHRTFIIERTLLRGRWQEFKDVVAFYGKEEVLKTLLELRYMDKRTLAFCSVAFKVPVNQFRCYRLAQSNPQHLDF